MSLNALPGDKLDVIVIDAGHGGKDPGTIGISGTKEKDINLPVALKFGQLIGSNYPNIKIIFTRSADDYIEVKERSALANSLKAKLFISIHCNHKKEEETEKNGFELYILNRERFPEAVEITKNENLVLNFKQSGNNESAKNILSALAQDAYLKYSRYLALAMESKILDTTDLASRGILQSGFWVLLGASMPSVLVECGYLSDKNDESYLYSEAGQLRLAQSLFFAFSRFRSFYELE
jgi:N-acetylmuramoyl-L-alanine amidase